MIGRDPDDFYERSSDEWSDGCELELELDPRSNRLKLIRPLIQSLTRKKRPTPVATHEAKGVNAGWDDPPRAEWKDDGDIVITFHQKASGIDQKPLRVASASAA